MLKYKLSKSLAFHPTRRCLFSNSIDTNINSFNEVYVEMRSDVKTLPTEKMRQSVLNAIFGDEAGGEDTTMNKLCREISDLFGKERAVFVPTGTMGNILSLCLNAKREAHSSANDYSIKSVVGALGVKSSQKYENNKNNNEYIIQGARSHLHKMELGGQLQIGFKPIPIKEIDELNESFDLEQIFKKEVSIEEFSKRAKVIAFENTHNYTGGKILNTEILKSVVIPKIKGSKYFSHLRIHLDGSRVLNSAAALKEDPKNLVSPFNTVNVCLSKALGAPCGSVILMKDEDYSKARQIRKDLGGAMRQAGFLAAPALVCLEDWRERFVIDHQNAKLFAQELNKIKGLKVPVPETNIVNIFLDENIIKNQDMCKLVESLQNNYKVLVFNFDGNTYIRAVIHHQVTEKQIWYAVESFDKVVLNYLKN